MSTSGSVATETITANVTRSSGKSTSNTYKIRWHYPSDNWRVVSADAPVAVMAPDTTASYIDANHNTQTVMMHGTSANFPIPAQTYEIPGRDGGITAVYFGGASAAWPGVAEALGLGTGPIGWGTAAILAGVGGYYATLTPPAPTPQAHTGDYPQYCADLVTQSNYAGGLPAGYQHIIIKSASGTIKLPQLLMEAQRVINGYPGDQGSHDRYYTQAAAGSKMTFTGATELTTRNDHYLGDQYGSQGFASSIPQSLEKCTGTTPEFQWTYSGP